MYDRNIFGSSSEVFGNLRLLSDIFGNLQKFSENVRQRLCHLRTSFEESSEIFGKWSEILGKSSKRCYQYFYIEHYMLARRYEFYVLVARAISHSFVALTREILVLLLEHNIHIFSPPCNILHVYFEASRNQSVL